MRGFGPGSSLPVLRPYCRTLEDQCQNVELLRSLVFFSLLLGFELGLCSLSESLVIIARCKEDSPLSLTHTSSYLVLLILALQDQAQCCSKCSFVRFVVEQGSTQFRGFGKSEVSRSRVLRLHTP